MSFYLKNITHNDDRKNIIEKINFNFSQITFNGIGSLGDYGPEGNVGPQGPNGKTGNQGTKGERGIKWFASKEPPEEDSVIDNDYWINLSTGNGEIFKRDGQWTNTGYTLYKNDNFIIFSNIEGSGSIKEKNAIIPANIETPWKNTFVISDTEYINPNEINPNLSKFKITLKNNSEKPLLSLININPDAGYSISSFLWRNKILNDNSLIFKSNEGISIEAGKNIDLLSGSRDIFASNNGGININNNGSFHISSGGDFIISSGGILDDEKLKLEIKSETSLSIKTQNFYTNSNKIIINGGFKIESKSNYNLAEPPIKRFSPRLLLNAKQNALYPIIDIRSYSVDNLDQSVNKLILDEYKYKPSYGAEEGGVFKSELVMLKKNNILHKPLPYLNFGLGFVFKAVNEIKLNIQKIIINSVNYSYVDLSNSNNYNKEMIQIICNGQSFLGDSTNNLIWIKIKKYNNSNINFISKYKIGLRGFSNELIIGDNINSSYKIGGIIYNKDNDKTNYIINFDFPVSILELNYLDIKKLAFYKNSNSDGVINFNNFDYGPLIEAEKLNFL